MTSQIATVGQIAASAGGSSTPSASVIMAEASAGTQHVLKKASSSSNPPQPSISSSPPEVRQTPTHHSVLISLTSGAMAGAVAKTVIAPLDRTKIYFQTHPERSYRLKRAFKYIHTTYQTQGVLFLWRGNSATMARIVPYAAFQFLAHDQYKRLLGIHAEQKHLSPDVASTKHLRHYLAGSLAGVTGQTLTYPLDRARAVMAVTQIGEYKNLMDVFKRTVANEGWLALYRGFVPTILGVIPYAGTSFFTYEQLKAYWISRAKESDPEGHDHQPTSIQKFCSGAFAGLLGQTASYPLDIVRRRMQTATQMGVTHNKYASVVGTLAFVLRKEGIRKGWYKGVSMNFIKGPISVGTSFLTYDLCSTNMKKLLSSSD